MSTEPTSPTSAQLDQADLDELAATWRTAVDIADRKYRLKTYAQCFIGSEACQAVVEAGIAGDYEQAVLIGNLLLDGGVFHHVVREHSFKNEYLFYRFAEDEDHGKTGTRSDGSTISWYELIGDGWKSGRDGDSLLAELPDNDDDLHQTDASYGVEPLDEHNATLLDNVHPRVWDNPTAKDSYNMVVIGAGTGGLVTAAACAGLGGRTALIEANLMGGDCLNVGCVPSKALLRCARAAAQVRRAADFGVRVRGVDDGDLADRVEVDFAAVMERLRSLRAGIAPHDSARRFSQDLGIDVFFGRAHFTGKNTVEVAGQTLTFARACIATGGSPGVPPIDGLKDVPFHTNHTLFNLTELPPRLGVIGSGAIGIEMAQAFQRLGAQVTVFARSSRILSKEDEDAAALVQGALERDGVNFVFDARYQRISHREPESGQTFPRIAVELVGEDEPREFDALLVATGRVPNVSGLGLDAAGVAFDPVRGIEVNDKLQTSNPSVFAVGDVASRYQFTHAADFMARLVIRNALFYGRDKFSRLLIPWCTYTEPELAHVGLYERDLEAREIRFKTFTRHFADVDRSKLDGQTEGFVRVHVKHGTDEILGATVVGDRAGDLISELTLAMYSGTGLGTLANVIHPYPTAAEAIRQLGDQFNRTRLTPTLRKVFRGLLSIQR
ncbi:MAG: FAD-containing oxidoreductase [Myxococcota bacterium]